MLLTALRAAARNWPALLAWFLAGWIARILLLQLAGWLGADRAVYGLLVLPLAVLARLASYVGMFLVLRAELPHFPASEVREGRRALAGDWAATLQQSILPFFVIYAAWGMISEDVVSYTSLSLGYFQFDTGSGFANSPLSVPFGPVSISLVVGAFVARWLLGRFEKRLPSVMTIVSAYLEAVWVLITALVLRGLIAQIPGWFETRRMFAGIADLVAGLRDSLRWFDGALDVLGWLLAELGNLVAQPLAWLALAAVVFSATLATLPSAARHPDAIDREQRNRRRRDRLLPQWAQRVLDWASGGLRERWEPIAIAARLVRRSGPIVFGSYLLGFAVVTAATPWLDYASSRLLGPHEPAWWIATEQPIALLIALVTVPLQLALVAAMFDHALGAALREPTRHAVSDSGVVLSAAGPHSGVPEAH
ncbi:MAG: hypothetical protein ABJA11_10605 [Pseudolysinimonas sp.]